MPAAARPPNPDNDFRPGGRTRVIDRRGVTRPLCDLDDLPPNAPRHVRDAVVEANAHRWRGVLISSLSTLVIGALIETLWTSRSTVAWHRLVTANSLISLAIWMTAGILISALRSGKTGRTAVAHCLRAHLCPSCGYNLAATPPEPDGLTTCPECGGAWPIPFDPDPPPGNRRRCSKCQYDLSGLSTDARGRLTCPECGRPWRVGPASSQSNPIPAPQPGARADQTSKSISPEPAGPSARSPSL